MPPGSIYRNIRNKIWAPRDLRIFANSESTYAAFAVEIALFWGKWGRWIFRREPLAMMFAISAHCLYSAEVNNYCDRAKGRLWLLETTAADLAPLPH